MDIFILFIVTLLLIIGLLGCVFPILPGPPISFIGILVFHYFTSASSLTSSALWALGIIVILITMLDYWLQIYGVKISGGGKKSVNGALLGLFLGIFFLPPFGMLIGPFIGAFIGARMEGYRNFYLSLKIALGSFVGFLAGTILKLLISVFIIFLFLGQLLPSIAEALQRTTKLFE